MKINDFNKVSEKLPLEGEHVIAFMPMLECPQTKQVKGMMAIALFFAVPAEFNFNGEQSTHPSGWYYADAVPYKDDTGEIKLSNKLMPLRFEPLLWTEFNVIK